ncbi:uncharacterized protein LOC131940869 [Physella acuta]|uniref:uncharacterized protein LOC131940869 n=1 Tax=Physella acuta TaxID=109671 RepID=UPI0027DB72EC|nr:uncharacterized protein LOC131940869 [Physella acuta]
MLNWILNLCNWVYSDDKECVDIIVCYIVALILVIFSRFIKQVIQTSVQKQVVFVRTLYRLHFNRRVRLVPATSSIRSAAGTNQVVNTAFISQAENNQSKPSLGQPDNKKIKINATSTRIQNINSHILPTPVKFENTQDKVKQTYTPSENKQGNISPAPSQTVNKQGNISSASNQSKIIHGNVRKTDTPSENKQGNITPNTQSERKKSNMPGGNRKLENTKETSTSPGDNISQKHSSLVVNETDKDSPNLKSDTSVDTMIPHTQVNIVIQSTPDLTNNVQITPGDPLASLLDSVGLKLAQAENDISENVSSREQKDKTNENETHEEQETSYSYGNEQSNEHEHISEFPDCKINLLKFTHDYAMFYLYKFLNYRYEAFVQSGRNEIFRYVYITTGWMMGYTSIRSKADRYLKHAGYKNSMMWMVKKVRVDLSTKGEVEEDVFTDSDDETTHQSGQNMRTVRAPKRICKTIDLRGKNLEEVEKILKQCVSNFKHGNSNAKDSTNLVLHINIIIDNNDEENLKHLIESYLRKSGDSFSYKLLKVSISGKQDPGEKPDLTSGQDKFKPTRSHGGWPKKGEYFKEPEDKSLDVRRSPFDEAMNRVVHFTDRMSKLYWRTEKEKDRFIYIITGYGKHNNRIKGGIAHYFKVNAFGNRYVWINVGLVMLDLKDDIGSNKDDSDNLKTRHFVFKESESKGRTVDIRGKTRPEAMDIFRTFLDSHLETYRNADIKNKKANRYVYVISGYKASNPDIGPVLKPAVQDYLDTNGYKSRHKWFNSGGLVMIDLEEDDDVDDVTSEDDDDDDDVSSEENGDVTSDDDVSSEKDDDF